MGCWINAVAAEHGAVYTARSSDWWENRFIENLAYHPNRYAYLNSDRSEHRPRLA